MARLALSLFLFIILVPACAQTYTWTKLISAPYNGGKQDDIYFVNPDTGWSINGSGKIYRTYDGGATWTNLLTQTGTYFRCVGFISSTTGFAGNVGTDYYPGVTDTVPFYKTTDGGATWIPVSYTGPVVKGLCAINTVATPFINAGILDTNYTIYAAGRVGSPAFLLKSTDNGNTWISKDLSAYISMITDVKFISKDTGFLFGGTNGDIASSSARIIYTTDGGNTFTTVYQSARSFEMIWKAHFPTRNTGYATILNFGTATTQRYIAKTTDGGLTWSELPLANNSCQEFGIGFLNDQVGWVGTDGTGFQTIDGGATWTPASIGQYANKIRLIPAPDGVVGYAIGLNVYKLHYLYPAAVESPANENTTLSALKAFPNPTSGYVTLRYTLCERQKVTLEVYDLAGRKLDTITTETQDTGEKNITYSFKNIPPGIACFVLHTKSGQSKIQVSLQP